MLSNRNGLMALFAASLLVLTLASSSLAADSQPDYQNGNSIQNMFENYMDWKDYTDELDAIWLADDANVDAVYLSELVGEAYSATLNLITHMEDQAYPTGSCAQDFYYHYESMLTEWAQFYGAMYFQLTATVGEAVDPMHFFDEAGLAEEWFVQSIKPKCVNKLDM